jgi:hypothetical protein
VTPAFVLVHSPIASPFMWSRVAAVLQDRDYPTLIPRLPYVEAPNEPFWQLHARAVATALDAIPRELSIIIAGHSGGGALLPAIREIAGRPVAAYLFIDAAIPHDGEPRAEGAFWAHLSDLFARGEPYPSWTPEEIQETFADPVTGERVANEGRPHPQRYWREPIRVFEHWPDAPCALIRFMPSPAYEGAAAEARLRNWPIREPAGWALPPSCGAPRRFLTDKRTGSVRLDLLGPWGPFSLPGGRWSRSQAMATKRAYAAAWDELTPAPGGIE